MSKKYIGIGIFLLILLGSIGAIAKFTVLKDKGGFTSRESVLSESTSLHEAKFYATLAGGRVQCELCPNKCILNEGQRGVCKVRQNIDGKLYSLVYGKPVTLHVDPVEKKPYYHVLPGSKSYSLATAGCNLACKYCQNWDISQRFPEDLQSKDMTPEQIVEDALQTGSESIAFTYSEPTVFYEYMYDIAKLAQEKGLKTVVVSSGYISPEPLRELIPHLDAYKVDLKAFNDETYQSLIGGHLQPVLDTLKILKESGIHFEIVNLLVPTYNDSEEEITKMCTWIKDNLGVDVPLHFSRFTPLYKLENLPPTPEETVKRARQICMDLGLNYVYTGNIADVEGSTTYCPDNNEPLIVRKGFAIIENKVDENGQSPNCPRRIPGVWK